MLKNIVRSELGSALLTVLVLSLIISGLILTLLSGSLIQRRSILYSQDKLLARYAAESGVEEILASLHQNYNGIGFAPKTQQSTLQTGSHVEQSIRRWGAFLHLKSVARSHRAEYEISVSVGLHGEKFLSNGLIVNPAYPELLVTGQTRIVGDAAVGLKGVKSANTRGIPYTGDRLVYGTITRSREDKRPVIDYEQVQSLFTYFDQQFRLPKRSFQEFVIGDSLVQLPDWPEEVPIVEVTAEELNREDWQIRGALTLVCNDTLIITSKVFLGRYVTLLTKGLLQLSANVQVDEAILYASEGLRLHDVRNSRGQFFSRGNVEIINSKLSYPSCSLVWSDAEEARIILSAGTTIKGSVYLLTVRNLPVPRTLRGKLIIDEDAILIGLAFSDNLCELKGEVNGSVITDRFHFYYSPTEYYNRIMDGRIQRSKLKHLELPLFFKDSGRLTVMETR
ncbi:MAG: pilus assembly PilX N-terminal domain-containing protein [Calditrichia bacterium]